MEREVRIQSAERARSHLQFSSKAYDTFFPPDLAGLQAIDERKVVMGNQPLSLARSSIGNKKQAKELVSLFDLNSPSIPVVPKHSNE